MPDHLRKAIRHEVVATLSAVAALAGRVTATRLVPVHQDQLPQICVYTMDEDSASDGTAQGMQRELRLVVEILVAGNAGLDDEADDLATAVEEALAQSRTRAGRAYDTLLLSTRFSVSREGEEKTGHCQLAYSVFYRTSRASPTQNNP